MNTMTIAYEMMYSYTPKNKKIRAFSPNYCGRESEVQAELLPGFL